MYVYGVYIYIYANVCIYIYVYTYNCTCIHRKCGEATDTAATKNVVKLPHTYTI